MDASVTGSTYPAPRKPGPAVASSEVSIDDSVAKSSVEISVVLCTYHRAVSLAKTLQSFAELVVPSDLGWELIVIDNNSKDNTRSVIENFAASVKFPVRYVFESRQGKSHALNTGVTTARGEIIGFTDDDVILHPDWLVTVKRGFNEFDCLGVGGKVLPLWDQPKPDWLEMEEQQAIVHFDLGTEWKQTQTPPLGVNMAFRRRVFSQYGNFRCDLGVSGGDDDRGATCEDTEFGRRLLKAGETIVYAPTALIYHPVAPHRLTKRYFLNWYYNDGRSTVRAFGSGDNVICYFGIPRWLYRGLGVSFMLWMFSLDSKRRFHHKLRTYRAFGRIVEARRLAGRTHSPPKNRLSEPTAG